VLEAIRNNPMALEFASDRLKRTKIIGIVAV